MDEELDLSVQEEGAKPLLEVPEGPPDPGEVVLSVAEIERVWDEDTDEKLHSGSMELGFVFEGFLVVFA